MSELESKLEMLINLYKLSNENLNRVRDNLSSMGSLLAIVNEKIIAATSLIEKVEGHKDQYGEAFNKAHQLVASTINAIKLLAKDFKEQRNDIDKISNLINSIEEKIDVINISTSRLGDETNNIVSMLLSLEKIELGLTQLTSNTEKWFEKLNNNKQPDNDILSKLKLLPLWAKIAIFVGTISSSGFGLFSAVKKLISG